MFGFLALSIHQLAAQGEMVFLASRIEQGRQLCQDLKYGCFSTDVPENTSDPGVFIILYLINRDGNQSPR